MQQYIHTLEELKQLLCNALTMADIEVVENGNTQLLFMLEAKTKSIYEKLLPQLPADKWEMIGRGRYFFNDDNANFSVMLNSVPPSTTMVIAIVNDLHRAHLKQYA